MTALAPDDHPHGPLLEPGLNNGLRGVFRRRYLLKLLVQKELKARYQATLLGLAWSYVKPLTRFLVYYLLLGIGLRLGRDIPNFAVHVFCGLIIVHLMSETMTSATKSIVSNRMIVRKMNVPREMLPMTSLLVSTYHTLPQYVILFAFCLFGGWAFSFTAIAAALLGFAIVWMFGLAFALFGSAVNVYYRDFGNASETLTMLLTWSVPMIYGWERVTEIGSGQLFATIYQFNPIAIATMLTQRGFWYPTTIGESGNTLPDDLLLKGCAALLVGFVFVYIGQKVFSRLEGRFAEFL